MRLLLQLEGIENSAYDLEYYHKLQGLIYTSLRKTHSRLHEKSGYKFFCFSNIFPIGDIKEGDKRKLLVSSPDSSIIKALNSNIPESINIGECQFNVDSRKIMEMKLKDGGILKTPTPVVVRIPKVKYSDYGIVSNQEYVYWRPQYPVNAFLKQLEENLHKKYSEYHGEKVTTPLLFEDLQLIKNPAVYTTIEGKRIQIIGSTWEFHLNQMTPEQKKLLQFGIDCGFGELNTLGFGFINQTKND